MAPASSAESSSAQGVRNAATSVPATIEAENYLRAIDTEPGNQGQATEFGGDVDIWPMYRGEGFVVGRIRPTESISYKISVATAGEIQWGEGQSNFDSFTIAAVDVPVNPFGGLPFDSGQIEAADYADNPRAIEVWKYVTNGFHEGSEPYDESVDTQIIHRESDGDPLPALDGQVHAGYRRMQTDGPQSLWDAREQPNHTRSQLGAWGRYSSIHASEEGQREFIVYSVRLDPASPIRGSVEQHTGLYWLSMVSQFKSIGPPGNDGPVISVYEGQDGLQLKVRDNDSTEYVRIPDVPRGVWLRIGIDVLWSSGSDGAYRWWGDLDGDSSVDFVPLSDRRSATTILPGFDAAVFNIGPYHTDEVERNGRDYANIEILSHPADDPWG